MRKRVVVTGMGVISSIGNNLADFNTALQEGKSGIEFMPDMVEKKFASQVAALPKYDGSDLIGIIDAVMLRGIKSKAVLYSVAAATQAWLHAGLIIDDDKYLPDTGCVFGTGVPDLDMTKNNMLVVDTTGPKHLGTRVVEQLMCSGVSAYLSGIFGLGNRVLTNSVACATGTQSIVMGYEAISRGAAKRMVVGSCEASDIYTRATFDGMRILNRKSNIAPEKASRPMSATRNGFVIGAGAGAMVIEEMETALKRNATIYAEVKGGTYNSGGQRYGGTMTAPNSMAVKQCITDVIEDAEINADDIDLISGHLTATYADKTEVENYVQVLNRNGENFPYINSLKSMIGHCLCAAGSIEAIASVLQLHHSYIHASINSEDLDEEIANLIAPQKVPQQKITKEINTILKANFGFGDVNATLIISRFKH